MTTDNFSIPELAGSQSQKHVTVNEGFRVVDTALNLTVIRADNTAPPVGPSEGDKYIPFAPATGAWVGKENQIATFINSEWIFFTPAVGWRAYDQTVGALLIWDGTAWTNFASAISTSAGNGSAAAPAFSFGSDSDTGMYRNNADELAFATNGVERLKLANSLVSSTVGSWLLDNAGSDSLLDLNKDSASDQAQMAFKTGFTHYASMGLLGNNDFTIKVGSGFATALTIDNATGAVSLPVGGKFSAYCNYRMYCAANAWVKVDTNNENFDVGANYDTGTKRFDAPVDGEYNLRGVIEHSVNGTVPTSVSLALYVNGAIVARTTRTVSGTLIEGSTVELNEVLQLTAADYVELYVYMTGQDGYVQADTNSLSGFYIP